MHNSSGQSLKRLTSFSYFPINNVTNNIHLNKTGSSSISSATSYLVQLAQVCCASGWDDQNFYAKLELKYFLKESMV